MHNRLRNPDKEPNDYDPIRESVRRDQVTERIALLALRRDVARGACDPPLPPEPTPIYDSMMEAATKEEAARVATEMGSEENLDIALLERVLTGLHNLYTNKGNQEVTGENP
ncbi:MAG TPA: hypothetical protein VLG92_02625 [Candidatus Saccharimonadia bacterium]|nr:hypothetical protein [Candidatus Saccharimonadia bacterium]